MAQTDSKGPLNWADIVRVLQAEYPSLRCECLHYDGTRYSIITSCARFVLRLEDLQEIGRRHPGQIYDCSGWNLNGDTV